MSNPLTFIIPCLGVIALFALIGSLCGGEEKPTAPATPADAELLAREVRELRKRLALSEKGGAR